ncbi:unnamed protein product, partial [Ectocarpus sp. 8 AP-2014]
VLRVVFLEAGWRGPRGEKVRWTLGRSPFFSCQRPFHENLLVRQGGGGFCSCTGGMYVVQIVRACLMLVSFSLSPRPLFSSLLLLYAHEGRFWSWFCFCSSALPAFVWLVCTGTIYVICSAMKYVWGTVLLHRKLSQRGINQCVQEVNSTWTGCCAAT